MDKVIRQVVPPKRQSIERLISLPKIHKCKLENGTALRPAPFVIPKSIFGDRTLEECIKLLELTELHLRNPSLRFGHSWVLKFWVQPKPSKRTGATISLINRHHLIPKSKGGERTDENLLPINVELHIEWHNHYDVKTWEEVITDFKKERKRRIALQRRAA